MARKLNSSPQSRAPLQWGEGIGDTMASRLQECPNRVPCNTLSKEETAEKEETKEQVPRTCLREEYL